MILSTAHYKNIIFDLGGVILNIDYSLTAKAFEKIQLENFDSLFSQAKQQTLFDKYEKGEISSIVFRQELKSICKIGVNDNAIDNAWNAMLLSLPKERLTVLKKIKKTHRSFLLSNTNEIHIDAFHDYLLKDFKIPDLTAYFEKIYLSYKVGMRKPDVEIFQLVLEENQLIAQETLFIDDSIQHIESAKKIGIQTYWLDVTKESIADLFA